MPYKIGLTGGIGSGKSTVADAFAELDVPTFSADTIGHALSAKHQPAYQKIVELFGQKVLTRDGELDRAMLGNLVFQDKMLKTKLETILHPLILASMHHAADAESAPYCVLDIPLLVNTEEVRRVDRVLVIHCDRKKRIERIRKRNGWSDEKIAKVMDSQASEQDLKAAADDVVDNNGSLEDIKIQVLTLHKKFLVLAASKVN